MTLRSPVPGAPPKLRSTNSVPPPQAASSQCKLNLHFIYDAVWNRPHSVLLMFNRGVALNVFCFRFFLWLTFPFGEKKTPVQTRRSEVVWWEAVGVFPAMMMMTRSELCCDALFDLTSIIGPGSVSNAERRCESRFPGFPGWTRVRFILKGPSLLLHCSGSTLASDNARVC